MIFFFKSDGTLIKSAPETVYQGSAEAGKVYVVAPLNANMLVDVYYELPNGERWGAYLLENNGTVINNEELPDGWALWSTTLESAITQYAGTLKAQFGFYQSGTADKVPIITSQGVTITIAKGVVRDLPSAPTADVYAQIVNAISSIKQDIANFPNEYLSNTNEDKIALKNNSAIEYSENATAGTIVKRDSDGKINVADGTEDLNAVNVGQFNAALNDLDNTYVRRYKAPVISERRAYVVNPSGNDETVPIHTNALGNDLPIRTATGQLKATDGVADDDLATVKQLNAVQGNYSDITNIDLNTGDTTVEYDTELGITVNAKGTVTHENGATEQPTTKFELPIIAGAGVSIDKKNTEEKVEVKSLNSNIENGTGDVLVQTTDTNHSFKVMKDGRAKVQSAPTEDDDVVRKKELDSTLTSVYTYKGSKDTYANLPATGNNVGDVWNVEDTGNNYAWNGTNWDSLSANVLDSTGNSTVQAMSQKATTEELNKKVNISDNFVKVFTIPNGASAGTLTADVKQKLCNPDGHNYYVYDDTSEMILKYSFNSDDEIIQYKAAYLQNDKAYEITMQILPSNGSWRRSQTVLNGATANPTLTGTEAELIGLKVGGTNYKIPVNKEYVDNGFVKKTTGHNRVYATDSTGTDSDIGYSQFPINSAIIQYSSAGTVRTNDPIYELDAVNKRYVDDGFVRKVTTATQDERLYGLHANGTQFIFATSQNVPATDHIAQYTVGGNIRTNTPIDNLDCANKKYVDDKIAALGKLYQHNYTFEAGTNNYVYCTTYKNSNTPMTVAEVINFFKSDPSVGKVVNVCVVDDGTTVGSGYFFDAGEGIDYTVIVLGSSANFIITADTNMTTNIIEL